jgi:hypothetical protein
LFWDVKRIAESTLEETGRNAGFSSIVSARALDERREFEHAALAHTSTESECLADACGLIRNLLTGGGIVLDAHDFAGGIEEIVYDPRWQRHLAVSREGDGLPQVYGIGIAQVMLLKIAHLARGPACPPRGRRGIVLFVGGSSTTAPPHGTSAGEHDAPVDADPTPSGSRPCAANSALRIIAEFYQDIECRRSVSSRRRRG